MASHTHRQTTRADVARLAGVSTAVVSYVINGGPRGVSPEARAKVELAIEQLGYRPNPSARALKTGSTGLIGVIVPEIINAFFAESVEALDQSAKRRHNSLLLAVTHDRADKESELVWSLIDRGVDAMVFACHLTDERLYEAGGPSIPRVFLDRSFSSIGHHTIGADYAKGARDITSHLADHGHRRIAFVGGALPRMPMDLRLDAWTEVLKERNLPRIEPIINTWDREGGYRGARQLMSLEDPPTAIFAASDFIAIGVLHALHELGMSIPQDVAVASFDGTAESAYSWPSLTTVRQPFAQIADDALNLINVPASMARHITEPMDLIIRNSCGCPAPITIL